MNKLLVVGLWLLMAGTAMGAAREHGVYRAFRRDHPCPATGETTGACPGWQVDHRVPLWAGGPDEEGNMQWLTLEEHLEKTAREAGVRAALHRAFFCPVLVRARLWQRM